MPKIQSRPFTYFAGITADGKQALVGANLNSVLVLLFDKQGSLIEIREFPLELDLALEAKGRKKILDLRRELGIRKNTIEVQPFFLKHRKIGLKLLPLGLEDFLEHPDDFPPDEAEIFRADIAGWKEAHNCVLVWGNDYHLSADGLSI